MRRGNLFLNKSTTWHPPSPLHRDGMTPKTGSILCRLEGNIAHLATHAQKATKKKDVAARTSAERPRDAKLFYRLYDSNIWNLWNFSTAPLITRHHLVTNRLCDVSRGCLGICLFVHLPEEATTILG